MKLSAVAILCLVMTFVLTMTTDRYIAACERERVADAKASYAYMTWARYVDVGKLRGRWPGHCGK